MAQNFGSVLAYLDEHRDYDGLIIYTDGYAPCPQPPQNRRTRILWLFVSEEHYRSCYPNLQHLGQGAYLKPYTLKPRLSSKLGAKANEF